MPKYDARNNGGQRQFVKSTGLRKDDYNKKPPEPYDLFTGSKHAELAIAFNLAYDNVCKYIKALQNKTVEEYEALKLKDGEKYEALKFIETFEDKVFVFLRQYLWKGNSENKNSAGYELIPEEKAIIKKLLYKLRDLRNYHSHFWHNNTMMEFDQDLVTFIEGKHADAYNKLLKDNPPDAELYLKQHIKHPFFIENKFIKPEARVFFLSFFLNKGEMHALLQQRDVSKRNDTPEYQFKHKVFTFYSHREGASWDSAGIDNEILKQRDADEQKRIVYGRQAYRIFEYLKDVPGFEGQEVLPFILSTGRHVNCMDDLLLFIQQQNLFPFLTFRENETLYYADETESLGVLNEEKKGIEKKEREGYRYFTLNSNSQFEFEISYPVLKEIVRDVFLDENDSAANLPKSRKEHFKGVLEDCLLMRLHVYNSLKNAGEKSITPDELKIEKIYNSIYINYDEYKQSMQQVYYTADEWRNIPISPTAVIEKLLIEWHVSFSKGQKGELHKRKLLLNQLRPQQVPFDKSLYTGKLKNGEAKKLPANLNPEPLHFYLAYYYREQKCKKRTEDRFLQWGVKYLMDMGLVPDWYFELEQLMFQQKFNKTGSPYKLKNTTVWQKQIPENYRLRITDNQVNVGIEQDGKIYRLRIGEKVVKYLLYWHFRGVDNKSTSVNAFLLAIASDLAIIARAPDKVDIDDLQLLEKFAIPPLYFKTKVQAGANLYSNSVSYKQQAITFFTKKLQWVNQQLSVIKQLTRSQKNDVLFKAYLLFNFSETDGEKFFRKNEYTQMSVCHYMLNQDVQRATELVEINLFNKKRLPKEIYDIFIISASLNDYVVAILLNRQAVLVEKVNFLKSPYAKKTAMIDSTVDYFKIDLSDNNLSEEDMNKRTNARVSAVQNLPFSVHPALVLKYFYPGQYAAKVFTKESEGHKNLFYNLRNELQALLPTKNLREGAVLKIFEAYAASYNNDATLGGIKKRWVGAINDIKTKDILLLLATEKYLGVYSPLAASKFKEIRDLEELDLDNLFRKENRVIVNIDDVKEQVGVLFKNNIENDIYLVLRMHQVDDYFYRSQKDRLAQLCIYYLNWRAEEINFYNNHADKVDEIKKWPDGSKKAPITMAILTEAKKRNDLHAQQLVQYIFDYERRVIEKKTLTDNKARKQMALISFCKRNPPFANFEDINTWNEEADAVLKTELKNLRNKCLHTGIPLNGSYRLQTMPGTKLAEVLHITEQLGNNRAIPNIYEQDAKNEDEQV